ncbi:adenylyl-sulfate kinase [Burkholderia sp. WAC0059]|uniref:adenylyl-sulfate kinase n=1 Tax=Burkholderia sp. WAC0059 TaxID=2066022 RepID=UPI001CA5E5AE|nr:adenylyl-sulfate kinase [Burkholderia sp. WAC0059]
MNRIPPNNPALGEHDDGHRSAVFWLTGLSGAGKSTLAYGAQNILLEAGLRVSVLDGDVLRAGLNRDLGFSEGDRVENMRRTAEVAKILADAGMVVITSLISPLHSGRVLAREIIGARFHEIRLSAGLAICEARDPKGLYRRARRGEIAGFTGISSPYEVPVAADHVIDTGNLPESDAIEQFVSYIRSQVIPERAGRNGSI